MSLLFVATVCEKQYPEDWTIVNQTKHHLEVQTWNVGNNLDNWMIEPFGEFVMPNTNPDPSPYASLPVRYDDSVIYIFNGNKRLRDDGIRLHLNYLITNCEKGSGIGGKGCTREYFITEDFYEAADSIR